MRLFIIGAMVFIYLWASGLVHISHWRWWRYMFQPNYGDKRVGIFRNLPWVIPGRWGFFIYGFEFGSRQPGDKFGVWLKRHGLWPW